MDTEDEKEFQHFGRVLEARLRRGLTGGSGGRAGSPVGGSVVASPASWADGSPRDPEHWVLACGVGGQPFDEERFSIDGSYSSRADVQAAAVKLTEIRRAKRAKAPHGEIVRPGDGGVPSQSEYEDKREGLNRAEKREAIARQIAALEERRAALEEGSEE